MKVTLVCNARLPSERAHPLQVVRMWQAFAEKQETTLLYPFRFQREKPLRPYQNKFWEYYNVPLKGEVKRLPTLDAVHILDIMPFLVGLYSRVQQLSFASSLAFWFRKKERREAFVWSREIIPLPLLSGLYPDLPLFYEMHRFPGSQVNRQLNWLKGTRGVICITSHLADRLKESGYPGSRILVAPDGFHGHSYETLLSKSEARARLGIPEDEKMIVYTGHLYPWKGVDTVIEALRNLKDLTLRVIGGMTEDQQAIQQRNPDWPDNVHLEGHRPPDDIPHWLSAADLVVVPNSGKDILSREYTSPLKLYEALASGRPLLVSDLPSLREGVNQETAGLVEPDNVQAWKEAIEQHFAKPQSLEEKAQIARKNRGSTTWSQRAENIAAFMADADPLDRS